MAGAAGLASLWLYRAAQRWNERRWNRRRHLGIRVKPACSHTLSKFRNGRLAFFTQWRRDPYVANILTMKEMANRIIAHYERHARDWDADRNRETGSWNDKPWHDRFAETLPHGASVLDLGCGSGSPIAAFLAEHGVRVTGVDSSPTLISMCRQCLPDHRWMVGDMRQLTLVGKFDGILAWDSLFHLTPDDQRGMFDVFARHASPMAVLMFNSGPAHGEVVGSFRGDPLYHASLNPDEYTQLLANTGFEVVAHVSEDWQTGGGRTVWLARVTSRT